MKRFLFLLVILCTGSISLAQPTLPQAEELYRQGKFSAALQAYEEILKNHPKDPFVYYNIGNCYFKMNSKGLAAANYYRAFELAPRDADIRHNLTLALASGGEKFVPSGVPVVLHRAFFSLSLPELKGLVYLFAWGVCLLLWVCLVRRKWNLFTTFTLVVFLFAAGWLYARGRLSQEVRAVIAAPVAEIRSGPGKNFPASASAAQGHLLGIEDEKDAWYEVILKSQGVKGWIEKNAVEKI
ncbi:MAG: tetratricopeptide repeat protein [Elusimicrobiaceae bacterium]|nr:tetratricopeptide repeat protein [Elusimicrobiaceae bacterium]